jgi:UDP:flavonoid glycosyltransferase YjiC (YdhE family)
MRVMFTTTGSAGHLGPLLPFADAVRRAGGAVLLATRGTSAEPARAAGFDVWPFADAPAAERNAVMASLRGLTAADANVRMLHEVFGGMDARAALPGALEAAATWQPDVVVSEPSEVAGRLAAEHHGLPAVSVSTTTPRACTPSAPASRSIRAPMGWPRPCRRCSRMTGTPSARRRSPPTSARFRSSTGPRIASAS